MKIDTILNPFGLPMSPYSPMALQWQLVARGLGMMADTCRVSAAPERHLPAPFGAAVKQYISAGLAWNSALQGLTYDTINHGLGLGVGPKAAEPQENLDI